MTTTELPEVKSNKVGGPVPEPRGGGGGLGLGIQLLILNKVPLLLPLSVRSLGVTLDASLIMEDLIFSVA